MGYCGRRLPTMRRVTKKTIDGRQMTVISFADQGKHKVIAYVNDQNAIERVESSYGHPVVGDIKVVTHYGSLSRFRRREVPEQDHSVSGRFADFGSDDHRRVRANPPVDIEVPANVRSDPVPVKSEKVADGIWYITGVSAYSVLDRDEGLLDRRRGAAWRAAVVAVIAEVKKMVPNKPIKYLVNTHHHFDHPPVFAPMQRRA